MRVLIVAAHPDDIELSMGGTVNKLKRRGDTVDVVIFSSTENVNGSSIISEAENSLKKILCVDTVRIYRYDGRSLHEKFSEMRDELYKIRQRGYDAVYCNHINSEHPDHEFVSKAVTSIFVTSSICFFVGIRAAMNEFGNMYEILSDDDVRNKVMALSQYKTQSKRTYFNMESIIGRARSYGLEIGVEFAEKFYVWREVCH